MSDKKALNVDDAGSDRIVLSGLDDFINEEVVEDSGENEKSKDISNQRVLAITCLSFTIFVIAEIVGALV